MSEEIEPCYSDTLEPGDYFFIMFYCVYEPNKHTKFLPHECRIIDRKLKYITYLKSVFLDFCEEQNLKNTGFISSIFNYFRKRYRFYIPGEILYFEKEYFSYIDEGHDFKVLDSVYIDKAVVSEYNVYELIPKGKYYCLYAFSFCEKGENANKIKPFVFTINLEFKEDVELLSIITSTIEKLKSDEMKGLTLSLKHFSILDTDSIDSNVNKQIESINKMYF